eukprot:319930-Prymnesium_polylepis.1
MPISARATAISPSRLQPATRGTRRADVKRAHGKSRRCAIKAWNLFSSYRQTGSSRALTVTAC